MKKYIKSAVTPIEKEDYGTKLQLAKDPSTDIDTLVRIYHSASPRCDYELLGAILDRLDVPTELLVESVLLNDVGILHALANPKMPIEYLKQYARSRNYFERISVAKNPSTPPSLLEEMAHTVSSSDDIYVDRHIAENPNTPLSILKELSNSDDAWTRIYALRNPNATEEMHQTFEAEFRKYLGLFINTEGGGNITKDGMDDILRSICNEHGVKMFGSYGEVRDDGGYDYEATMEYIFDTNVSDQISDEFMGRLYQQGCHVWNAQWEEYDK